MQSYLSYALSPQMARHRRVETAVSYGPSSLGRVFPSLYFSPLSSCPRSRVEPLAVTAERKVSASDPSEPEDEPEEELPPQALDYLRPRGYMTDV
jgi:hypothetical protein